MTPQFLVAKYFPDMRRLEPRNIGVIVWCDGNCIAKFLGDGESKAGINAPKFIQCKKTYRRWLDYWRLVISKDDIRMHRGERVLKSDKRFVDALCDTSNGNYRLVSGGELMDNVKPEELMNVAEYLFDELVK